jgi:tetratricopeptide (TPR) repeat protein
MQKSPFFFFLVALCGAAFAIGCGGEPGAREFRKGVRAIERGDYVLGKTLLENSINQRPGSDANAIAYNYLGIASWHLNQIQRAIEAFEYSRQLDPKRVDPAYNLAAVLYDGGELARAVALLEEAAQVDPADPRSLEFLGSIHLKARKWPEARRALFGALARAPQSPRVLTALALVENSTGSADKAIFYLMQALERKPDYAPALFNLGILYARELKDDEQAVAYFRRYLDVAGADPHANYARGVIEAAVPARGVIEAAVPALSPAPAATPPPETPSAASTSAAAPVAPVFKIAEAKARTAETILLEARAEAGKGRIENAMNLYLEAAGRAERAQDAAVQEKILREAVRVCMDQSKAYYALGRFQLEHGQDEAAVRMFKQAITLDPKSALAHMGLAEAAARTGESDTAIVAIKKAVELDPANPDAQWMLASLYDQQLGIAEKAAQSYRQFERLFPGDPRILKARERVNALQLKAGSESAPRSAPPPAVVAPVPVAEETTKKSESPAPPKQRLQIQKPLVRNTQVAIQAYNRGTLYQRQEDWDRAIYYYTRAVENDDSFATAFFNLGAVYWARGEYDLAKDAYRRALELMPDMIAARYNLALIHRELRERGAAVEQLATLVGAHPEYAPAYYALGLIYGEDPASVELAKRNYRKFIGLAPNDPNAGIVRAWIEKH